VEKQIVDVPQIYPKRGAYNNAVKTRGGWTVYCSGVVGAHPDGSVPGDFAAQADLAFRNLAEVLREAGGSLSDIVKITIYVGEDFPGIAADLSRIRARYFVADHPASMVLRVAGFAGHEYLIQIDAVAVLSD